MKTKILQILLDHKTDNLGSEASREMISNKIMKLIKEDSKGFTKEEQKGWLKLYSKFNKFKQK